MAKTKNTQGTEGSRATHGSHATPGVPGKQTHDPSAAGGSGTRGDGGATGAPSGPALSLLLLSEIPSGLFVLDALAKEAHVRVLRAGSIQDGRYLVLFGGDVGAVERSHARALAVAAPHVLDDALLPHAEERIVPALLEGLVRWPAPGDTLAVLQAATPPVLLLAVDRALKGAHVELVELRVGDGLGGKAIASLWGETHDVQAAVDLAGEAFARRGAAGVSTAIIPRADDTVRAALGGGSRFFREWRG